MINDTCSWPSGDPLMITFHDRELRKRGFTFVGSTICYAFMQAAGLVNDHLVSCFRHSLKNIP